MTPSKVLRVAAIGLGIELIACATQDLASVDAARDAYDQCVTIQGSRAECETLHARFLTAQHRYEQNARSAWGCDPAQEECPTAR